MGVYRLSQKAAADLDNIYTYTIERHGLVPARKYLNGLHTCFEHLAQHPMLGRRTDRIAPGVRRHECQSHVVFYVPDDAGVSVARTARPNGCAQSLCQGGRWRLAAVSASVEHLGQQAQMLRPRPDDHIYDPTVGNTASIS